MTDAEAFDSLRSNIIGDIPQHIQNLESRVLTLESSVHEPSDCEVEVPLSIQAQLDTKVDKVIGKQLSTEDFSSAEKLKLSSLPLEVIIDPSPQPTGSANGATGLIGNGSFNANPIPGDDYHLFEVTNNNSGKQCVRINSYGASSYGNNVHFCRYFGTQTTPSAIGSGAFLMSTGYRGHDGNSLSQSMAAFQVVATENWTPTSHGIRFQWEVTPKGSSIRKHIMELDSTALSVYGNLGAGKTPAPWHSNYRVLELGGVSGCAIRGHISEAELTLTSNAYFDSTYKRGSSDCSAVYQMTNGAHYFSVAGTGPAGSSITFKQVVVINNVGILSVAKDATSGRSISAAGTVNANGADYAEYMEKAFDFTIEKGDVVGISNGKLTNRFKDSSSFVIKSTDPSYVGGASWAEGLEGDELEIARKRVDRIAFCGRVPVNSEGCEGQYLIPYEANDGTILVKPVNTPSFVEYLICVGKVISVQKDGSPLVLVKVV